MVSTESEKDLEVRLVREVQKRGGMAIKLTSQFHRGLPDRLILLPFHTISFCELKSSGKAPTLLQYKTHESIRKLGFFVGVVDSTETLDAYLTWVDGRLKKMEEAKRIRTQAMIDSMTGKAK